MDLAPAAARSFRPLILAILALILAFRIGPLCDIAQATPPTIRSAEMAGCHDRVPAPKKSQTPVAACLTPCAVLAPSIPQPMPMSALESAPASRIHRALANLATSPDLPPPRHA